MKNINKRRKDRSQKDRSKMILIGMALFILCLIISPLFLKSGLNYLDRAIKKYRLSKQTKNQYLSRPEDQWLITSQEIEGDNFQLQVGLISETSSRIEKMLEKYQNIPEVAEQKKMFSKRIFVSFYSGQAGGYTKRVFAGEFKEDMLKDPSLEIVLYGKGHEHAPRIKDQFAKYDPEWRAVIIAGAKFSDQWADALIIHELEHAKMDRSGEASAHAPPASDLYINEELMAHDVESVVLNQATDGQYHKRLKEIIGAKRNIDSLKKLHDSLNIKDLKSLDQLFSPAGEREASLRLTQYLLDLGEIWLESKYAGEELKRQKINNYRLLRSL